MSLILTWSVPPSVASASTSKPVQRDSLRMRAVGRYDETRWRALRRPLTGAREAWDKMRDQASSQPTPIKIPIARKRRGQTIEAPAYPNRFMVSARCMLRRFALSPRDPFAGRVMFVFRIAISLPSINHSHESRDDYTDCAPPIDAVVASLRSNPVRVSTRRVFGTVR